MKIKRQRPEQKLRDVVAGEQGPSKKGVLIDKQFTAIKAPGSGEGSGFSAGLFEPTDEDMAVINGFTQRTVGAEEVACFTTLSCNDMIDRDDDRFTTECVDDFAKLTGPLSSVGKSFMVSHDYTKLPVGRIFDVGTETIEGTKFLTNKVYVPKLPENESFLANQEFGVYWAVSVGVMLEDSACSVCQSPMVGNYWTFCIEQGHEKGLYYDPDSDEKDAWGWAEPVDPAQKGAVKCTRDLYTPKDFYELSQVFLGAQYDAQIGSKSAATKGIIKAASALAGTKVPILNLAAKEAEDLPIQHVEPRVREAYAKGFTVKTEEDGTTSWTDADDLVWQFDPSQSEVLCLGEANNDDDEKEVSDDGEGNEGSDDDEDASGAGGAIGVEDGAGQPGAADGQGDDESADADPQGVGAAGLDANAADDEDEDDSDDEDSEDEDDSDDDDDEDDSADNGGEEGKSVSKKQVLAAALTAKLPSDVVAAAAASKGSGLDALLSAAAEKIAGHEAKAALGDRLIAEKRTEAVKWYVKNRQMGADKGVNVDRFNKMLDKFEDDIEMIEEVIEEQREAAQAKFPQSVRRSTADRDVHEIEEPTEIPLNKEAAEKIRKVHG